MPKGSALKYVWGMDVFNQNANMKEVLIKSRHATRTIIMKVSNCFSFMIIGLRYYFTEKVILQCFIDTKLGFMYYGFVNGMV